MARARATLRPAQMRAYGMLLHQLLSDKIRQDGKVRWIFDATPEEQAEAFLRVFLCDEMPEYSRRLESKQEGGGIDT